MARPKPMKIVVEFDDGAAAEADFDTLPSRLQFELLRQPFASLPSSDPEKEKFLLLEWEDGWKEVIAVDESCKDINRYYVISRPDDVGRLSLNKQDGYPELIEIVRSPLDLKNITFLDTYQLNLKRSDREGKKTDHFFSLAKDGNALSVEIEAFRKAAADSGIDLEELKRTRDPAGLREKYELIRRKLDLKAARRQQDVFDFIAYLAKAADRK
jgi:hypothetical protein